MYMAELRWAAARLLQLYFRKQVSVGNGITDNVLPCARCFREPALLLYALPARPNAKRTIASKSTSGTSGMTRL